MRYAFVTVSVAISIELKRISEINEQDSSFSFDAEIHLSWNQSNNESTWTPDLFFSNELDSNQKYSANGQVSEPGGNKNSHHWFQVRLTFACNMDMKRYPFDRQSCSSKISSCKRRPRLLSTWEKIFCNLLDSYKERQLQLRWTDDTPIKVEKDFHPGGHHFLRRLVASPNCSLTALNASCVKLTFVFQRNSIKAITNWYLPGIFLTFMSWFALILNPRKNTFIRMLVALISFAGNILIAASVEMSTSRVPYTRSIDYFVILCSSFSFAAVVETVLVICLTGIVAQDINTYAVNDDKSENRSKFARKLKTVVTTIEIVFRTLFSVFYLLLICISIIKPAYNAFFALDSLPNKNDFVLSFRLPNFWSLF